MCATFRLLYTTLQAQEGGYPTSLPIGISSVMRYLSFSLPYIGAISAIRVPDGRVGLVVSGVSMCEYDKERVYPCVFGALSIVSYSVSLI